MQNKAGFVRAIGEALHEYAPRTEVVKAEYVRDGYEEFAIITFTDDSQMNICITADSCLAIMGDIYKALW
ncbi:MAG: hypothetical protein K2H29_00235 [Oscillospiraceae bacterium]|nr:hypothetical protein [Oscillospiraceae bacterium]MDE5883501.1 hypothetical protein [Oscillospiraceae bacterium]